ncbi:MAG: glycosyltransferase family 2 protein, partial [Phocaeicola sp.]
MKRPKISLITISYNSAETIEDTIQSVLAQTYKNYEYIIIDGASTDSTMEIIDKYRDDIVKVISEPDRGISDAFNKGIRVATGDIIGICNSNDLLYPDAFQTIVDAYEEGIDAYRAPVTTKNFETGFEYVVRPTLYIPKIPFMASKCHMGCYITKDAYDKYGLYDEKFKYS